MICVAESRGDFMFFHFLRRKIGMKSGARSKAASGNPDSGEAAATQPGGGFKGAAVSDVGCVRPNNEDNFVLGKSMNDESLDHREAVLSSGCMAGTLQFAGVFDGMGGGEKGELASHDTARIFLDAFGKLTGDPGKTDVDTILRHAFLTANNRIVDLQKECKVFGTTATVLCVKDSEFKIYHLGDSRAYLFREEKLLQLTKDQTLAQMKMDVGMYRKNDPAMEADKHKLTEYIGRDWTKANIRPVESRWIPAQNGDRVLLCSDGLYDMCSDEEIARILSKAKPADEMAAALVQEAIFKGGEDNVTCIVLAFD